jgi:tetratricopeptide (TPR) repeat protein
VGAFLAQGLCRPEAGDAALALYLRLLGNADGASRDLSAQGMRESPVSSGEFGPWVRALADALARGDDSSLRRPSGTPPAFGWPARIERLLQFSLAVRASDWPEAEVFARQLLADAPGQLEAAVRVGAVLLQTKKYDDVLALHGGAKLAPEQRAQRVQALQGLARKDEALAEARTLVRETEGSDRALLVLGRLLRGTNPDAALAALSPAAGHLEVDVLRGELLEQRGADDAAVQVYEEMLRASGNRDLRAWQGLARVRSAQGRDLAFVQRVTSAIDEAPRGAKDAELAPLYLLRGQAQEKRNDVEGALKDYLRVIEAQPKNVVALNNAAWLLGTQVVRRPEEAAKAREQALALAERAVREMPDAAPVHHTRAKILVAAGRADEALVGFDKAIERVQADLDSATKAGRGASEVEALRGRFVRYLYDRAEALEKKGDVEGAKTVYRRIRDEFPRTYPATQSKEALKRLGE